PRLRLRHTPSGWELRGAGPSLPCAPGSVHCGDRPATVLARQHYQLMPWQEADRSLSYRRFFDVAGLVGVRVEDPVVFAATHQRLLGWMQAGYVDGVRLDHVDGLRDPLQYLRRLHRAAPRRWIVVEKILTGKEALRRNWPMAGTTGYDFLNLVLRLLVDPAGRAGLDRAYRGFAGAQPGYRSRVRRERARVLGGMFAGEVNQLAGMLDQSRPEAHRATVAGLAAACPLYRTYVSKRGPIAREDRRVLAAMRAEVRSLEASRLAAHMLRGEERAFTLRLQQLTPAVFAKAVEDTASYQYHRLAALNEVGGDPLQFGVSVAEFHAACAYTQKFWPRTMLTTATHDTKRGEDVRARLALLSEIPARWQRAVRAWARLTERHRRREGPDRNLQYLFFQTLVGAWPISAARMLAYMRKAAREAKEHTSWRRPDPAYEAAVLGYVAAVMRDRAFMAAVEAWLRPLLEAGWINSLTQLALKLTAPGVPDIYNGCELWDLSLVDPDNRRPVNFAARKRRLRELERGLAPEAIWARRDEGLPKLWLMRQGLHLRRCRADAMFGAYTPLPATGPGADRVIAFVRGGAVATVTQRFPVRAAPWRDTHIRLPRGTWINQLTGDRLPDGRLAVAAALRRFPVALLERAA
ncbi:MAG: malto-oligosyltrehalose synthase, partial [Terriglobales bacterium]